MSRNHEASAKIEPRVLSPFSFHAPSSETNALSSSLDAAAFPAPTSAASAASASARTEARVGMGPGLEPSPFRGFGLDVSRGTIGVAVGTAIVIALMFLVIQPPIATKRNRKGNEESVDSIFIAGCSLATFMAILATGNR